MIFPSGFSFIIWLSGSIYLLGGLLTLIYPPRIINYLYGYRTKRSMSSQKN